MHSAGHIESQGVLCRPAPGRLARRFIECGDLVSGKQREEPQVATDIAVVCVDPELVELVRRRARRIQPHGASLSLPEFGTTRCCDEWQDQSMCLAVGRATD